MRPRQSILEVFSTFLLFEADRFGGWATDAALRRSMNRLMQASSASTSADTSPNTGVNTATEQPEQFWVIYWFKRWQGEPAGLAKTHLTAYLQEVCYWASQKTMTGFNINQYGLSDCFQVAIARTDKILRGFNPNYGGNLKTYASIAFGGLIREFLRQRQVVDICSDWALLRKISQKRLTEALQTASLPVDLIPAYVLAWRCFKTVHVPTQASSTRSLPKPNDAIWQAVTVHYNTERKSQLATAPEATPAQIETWLHHCVKATRAYLYPTTTSINAPRGGQETGELLDTLTDVTDSLLTTLIVEEEQQARSTQQNQLNQVLTTALVSLDPQVQQLLSLYYGQSLTQQEIAKQLDIKQYTISRRFSKARETLLAALVTWSESILQTPTTQEHLATITPVLEEWLVNHFQRRVVR